MGNLLGGTFKQEKTHSLGENRLIIIYINVSSMELPRLCSLEAKTLIEIHSYSHKSKYLEASIK